MSLFLRFSLAAAAAVSLAGPATAAPGPWKVLFDGKSTDAWRGYGRPDFPTNAWKVENGELRTVAGVKDAVDIITKEKYGDFELELEWKLKPGGNSGIIYRAAEKPAPGQSWHTGPEMQILDDAKHRDGLDPKTSAGALYALVAPTNKTLKPAGEWNKVRLVVNGNHVEHWLNGVKVVEAELDSPEVKALIAASKFKDHPGFAKEREGHIVLQYHGDEVAFRNVRVRKLSGAGGGGAAAAGPDPGPNELTAEEKQQGWRLLFDGKTPAGWRAFKGTSFPSSKWAARDGCLQKVATGAGDSRGAGDIVTVDSFGDFDLRFDWRVAPGGNSGVKYLVSEQREGPIAHEYQVLDDERHPDGKVGPQRQSAAFYDVLPPDAAAKKLRPAGEWNQGRVLVRGNHVEHWLNGRKVVAYELSSPALQAAIAKSKFKDVAGFEAKLKGPILLQDHGDEVCYRNIKILAADR
jgi:Domain of Unknown Function (DUF1080)